MIYLILFLFSIILIYIYSVKKFSHWKKRKVVEANGLIWRFLFGKRSLPEHVKDVYDANDSHTGFFYGTSPGLILKDLEDVQAVFAGDFQSFYQRGFVNLHDGDVLSDNILLIDDYKRWKCIRQKLSPVFTSFKLKNMFYIMDRCAKDFVALLNNDPKIRQTPFNALYTYTAASIAASVFGIDINSTKSTMDSPFMDMARKSSDPSWQINLKASLNIVFPTLYRWLQFKLFGDFEEFFIGAVRDVLKSRRNATEKRYDFIEICLDLQKEGVIRDPQTEYEIEATVEILAAQAFFFFIAGTDASALTMHFALLELAGHPKVLEKVHKEIDSVFGNAESLNYNDIEKMTYLDMVLSESMRKYPNVGVLRRKCTNDTVLPASKIKMEKGSLVLIPVYGIHRDERYHPNPEVFDPERFSPENISKMKSYSFLPFGEGNRNCIGNRYARLQVKAGLAWLLRSYTLAESKYSPKYFEKSIFALRDTKATFQLIRRNV